MINKGKKQKPIAIKDDSLDDSEGEKIKEKVNVFPLKKASIKQKNKKTLNEKTKVVSDKSLQKKVQLLKKKTALLSEDSFKPETKKESNTDS